MSDSPQDSRTSQFAHRTLETIDRSVATPNLASHVEHNAAEPARIARTWRGATSATDADAYLAYLNQPGVGAAEYRRTPGNRGALVLRRIEGDRAEFLLISLWTSEEAIRAFAGDRISEARFFAEDDRYLIERDLHVDHYEIVDADPRFASLANG